MPKLNSDDEAQKERLQKLDNYEDYEDAWNTYAPRVTQKQYWDKVALDNRKESLRLPPIINKMYESYSGGIKKRSTRNKRTKRRKHCKRRRTSRK